MRPRWLPGDSRVTLSILGVVIATPWSIASACDPDDPLTLQPSSTYRQTVDEWSVNGGVDQRVPVGSGTCPTPACGTPTCDTINPSTPFVRHPAYLSQPIYGEAQCHGITKRDDQYYYFIKDAGDFEWSYSTDGYSWTYGGVAFPMPTGSWFSEAKCPDPRYSDGGGQNMTLYFAAAGKIGFATSTDGGQSFTDWGAPVHQTQTAGYYLDNPSVVPYGLDYVMAYTEACSEPGLPPFTLATIRLAKSRNGYVWSDMPNNPILVPGGCGDWDEGGLANPQLVVDPDGTTLHIFYMAAGWVNKTTRGCAKIGHAISTDGGLTWCPSADPVFDHPPAGSGAWDNVYSPVTSYTWERGTDILRMYYWGLGVDQNGQGISGLGVAHASWPLPGCGPAPIDRSASTPVALADARLDARPNPSTGAIVITHAIDGLSLVGQGAMSVYDVSGRRVRALWDGDLGAMPESITWDGRAQDGSDVAAGRYLVSMESETGRVASVWITTIR